MSILCRPKCQLKGQKQTSPGTFEQVLSVYCKLVPGIQFRVRDLGSEKRPPLNQSGYGSRSLTIL